MYVASQLDCGLKIFGGKSKSGGTRMRNRKQLAVVLNTDFVSSFGGKSGWRVRLQTGV